MNYRVLVVFDKEDFEVAVTLALADGWNVVGGVSYSPALGFMQAICRSGT